MATGFSQRFKGKIKAAEIYLDNVTKGLFDSGSGVALRLVWTNAGAPTNGTSGTLAKLASPGDLLIDTTNAVLYQNTNTLASPTWTALTTATGAGTYTGTFDGTVGGSTPAGGTFTTVNDSGAMTVGGALTGLTANFSGAETVGGTLKVTGAATLGGAASITGAVTAGSTLNLTGAATVGGALQTGAITGTTENLSGAATIGGAITGGSTLNLTGAATIGGATIIFSNLPTVAGATGVLYNSSGTLKVSP